MLGGCLHVALSQMGVQIFDLYAEDAGRIRGCSSSKEGDSIYTPTRLRGGNDWPTLVWEAGLSESLPHLRIDAGWWLDNAGGDVEIVVLVSANRQQRKITIEKWCLQVTPANRPNTRQRPNLVPTRMQQITITTSPPGNTIPSTINTQYVVTGAPLVLEFRKIFLRAPMPPETDIIYPAAQLLAFANFWWNRYW
jgi:hypothetical protein